MNGESAKQENNRLHCFSRNLIWRGMRNWSWEGHWSSTPMIRLVGKGCGVMIEAKELGLEHGDIADVLIGVAIGDLPVSELDRFAGDPKLAEAIEKALWHRQREEWEAFLASRKPKDNFRRRIGGRKGPSYFLPETRQDDPRQEEVVSAQDHIAEEKAEAQDYQTAPYVP